MTNQTTKNQRPESAEQLAALIDELTTFEHGGGEDGYQKSADAMWKAAVAAFNYAASRVGASGFQASWAALRFYGEVMHIDGPYTIIQLHDALYPQYDLPGRVQGFIAEQAPWLAEQATAKLADYDARPTVTYTDDDGNEVTRPSVHPDVVAHWRKLAAAGAE